MRIVAHSCSNTEIVCALGCGDRLVGVDDHSDFPVEVVSRVERVGPDLRVDVDRIEALRPDLVVYSLTVPGHEVALEALQARGIPTLVLEPVSLDDVYGDIRRVAAALGVAERGEALVGEMQRAIVPDSAVEAGSGPRPRVLVEWWPKPVIAPGRRSWVTDLIAAAGGVNPLADRDVKSTPLTDEEVRDLAPDVVVIAWCGVPERKYRPEVVLRREGWRDVPAVRDRRVVGVSEAFLGRPGPRLVDGHRALVEIVRSGRGPREVPGIR